MPGISEENSKTHVLVNGKTSFLMQHFIACKVFEHFFGCQSNSLVDNFDFTDKETGSGEHRCPAMESRTRLPPQPELVCFPTLGQRKMANVQSQANHKENKHTGNTQELEVPPGAGSGRIS